MDFSWRGRELREMERCGRLRRRKIRRRRLRGFRLWSGCLSGPLGFVPKLFCILDLVLVFPPICRRGDSLLVFWWQVEVRVTDNEEQELEDDL